MKNVRLFLYTTLCLGLVGGSVPVQANHQSVLRGASTWLVGIALLLHGTETAGHGTVLYGALQDGGDVDNGDLKAGQYGVAEGLFDDDVRFPENGLLWKRSRKLLSAPLSHAPSLGPTYVPSLSPTRFAEVPSGIPTETPMKSPTKTLTSESTITPTRVPPLEPSMQYRYPTAEVPKTLTSESTITPTGVPSLEPSMMPMDLASRSSFPRCYSSTYHTEASAWSPKYHVDTKDDEEEGFPFYHDEDAYMSFLIALPLQGVLLVGLCYVVYRIIG